MCGISRSVSVTIGYFLYKLYLLHGDKISTLKGMLNVDNLTPELIKFCRKKRKESYPNPGFVQQLSDFERRLGIITKEID